MYHWDKSHSMALKKLETEIVIITEKGHIVIKEKNKTQDRRLAYWVLTLNNFNREYKTIAFSPRFPYGRVSKNSTNDLEFLGVVWDAKHLKLSLWL